VAGKKTRREISTKMRNEWRGEAESKIKSGERGSVDMVRKVRRGKEGRKLDGVDGLGVALRHWVAGRDG